jgi:hypothetical protein
VKHIQRRPRHPLRVFAGGSPLGISVVHGIISHSEVFGSAWIVVDAVNQWESLPTTFPCCHMEQRQVAAEFSAVNGAGMQETCIGATGGLLIWTNKPGPACCKLTGCGLLISINKPGPVPISVPSAPIKGPRVGCLQFLHNDDDNSPFSRRLKTFSPFANHQIRKEFAIHPCR